MFNICLESVMSFFVNEFASKSNKFYEQRLTWLISCVSILKLPPFINFFCEYRTHNQVRSNKRMKDPCVRILNGIIARIVMEA